MTKKKVTYQDDQEEKDKTRQYAADMFSYLIDSTNKASKAHILSWLYENFKKHYTTRKEMMWFLELAIKACREPVVIPPRLRGIHGELGRYWNGPRFGK